MRMKNFLYFVLVLGVLFDIGAGTYLWQLIAERNAQRIDGRSEISKARESPREIKKARSRPTYTLY
jgi:hypothetical protein